MIIHLELNEDHLKLIRMVRIADEKDECLEIPKEGYLTITSHLLDDVAMVLGLRDQVIKGTKKSVSDYLHKKKHTVKETEKMIAELEKQMKEAARTLNFERAAELRDIILELKAG